MIKESFSLQHIKRKEEIGRKIKELRLKKGVEKSKDFAKIIKVHKDQMSHYETGKSEPRMEILKRIADFGEVTIDYFYESGEKPVGERIDNYVPKAARQQIHNNVDEILESKNEAMIDLFKVTLKGILEAVRTNKKENENKGGD